MKESIKRLVKLAALFFGFEVIKTHPKRKIKKRYYVDKPIKVEFVGVSGVGKTTLYKKLVKTRSKNDKWMPVEQFMVHYGDQGGIDDTTEAHNALLKVKTKRFLESSTYPIHTKIRFLTFFFGKLKNDIVLHKHNQSHKVVLDEGIIHNYGTDLVHLHDHETSTIETLLQNTAIVYCNGSTDLIAKNISKRLKMYGDLRTQHLNLSTRELNRKIEQSLDKKRKTLDLLRKFNVPVIEINTVEKPSENVNIIREFINGL